MADNSSVANDCAFISEREVGKITGICHRTLQKYRLLGRGPRYYKVPGGAAVRYRREEVIAWMQSGAVDPGQAQRVA